MLITTIQIKRFENSVTKLKGIANIILDDMIVIHDIKILQNGQAMFLAMPSKQMKTGTFKDIVHPIISEVRSMFEKLIIFAYEEAVKENYTFLEMSTDDKEANNLFEQKEEDFKIINALDKSFQREMQFESDETIRMTQNVNNTIDESLLKWFES